MGFVSQDSFVISNEDTGAGDADGGISFTGSEVPVITDSGRTITWNLGDVSNTNDDNSVAETLTFTYTVLTLNVTGNQHNTPLNNSVEITWDTMDADGNTVTGMGGPESATDVIVVEPQIDVTKTVVVGGSGTSGDAGDSVVYTIQLTADATRPTAYEAVLYDFLSSDLDFSSGSYGITSVVDPVGGLVISDFEITSPPNNELRLVSPPIDMVPGRQITITLSGELEETVYTGQNLINDAVATWTSRTGDVNSGAEYGERTGQDGAGGLNNYVSTGSVTIDIVDPEPQKLIVTTSEAHTGTIGDPRLVIGEIIRYRLEVRLAEGTTNDLILRDNLLPGMIFINDGTAKVIFVSTSGIDIDSQDSAVPDVVSGIDDPTAFRDDSIPLVNIVPVYVLPDGNISSSLDGNNDT
ncbi:MAG: hypothetical protein J7L35_05335 [Anaerolineales bacterium]|nr:hypothetical protein [Anaerolineales bacterium]